MAARERGTVHVGYRWLAPVRSTGLCLAATFDPLLGTYRLKDLPWIRTPFKDLVLACQGALNVAYGELALGNTENAVVTLLAANKAGADAGEINDFIARVLRQNRHLLAARLRIEVGRQNLKATGASP